MGRHDESASRGFDVPVTSAGAVDRSARWVGRVGALAVALGVGAAVVSVPLAAADTSGSAGSAGSGSPAEGRGSTSSVGMGTRSESRDGSATRRPRPSRGPRVGGDTVEVEATRARESTVLEVPRASAAVSVASPSRSVTTRSESVARVVADVPVMTALPASAVSAPNVSVRLASWLAGDGSDAVAGLAWSAVG